MANLEVLVLGETIWEPHFDPLDFSPQKGSPKGHLLLDPFGSAEGIVKMEGSKIGVTPYPSRQTWRRFLRHLQKPVFLLFRSSKPFNK